MEIRVHGRGGQGGVTCAKLLAAIYAELGKSVQAFGDYAGERSGAPIRAYARVSDTPVTSRNKVYHPDHLLVLDPTLLDDTLIGGLRPGGTLLLNTQQPPETFATKYPGFRVATVDATGIARRHGIGSRSVVVVNTTIVGAFARAQALPHDALRAAYEHMGLGGNMTAALEAFDAVKVLDVALPAAGTVDADGASPSPWAAVAPVPVGELVRHFEGPPPGLKTGNWRSQTPRYMDRPAPCNVACPAGNDVVGFIQALWRQGEAAAAEVLARSTPFPGVCGRVCPAPCMSPCNRGLYDDAVNIRALERYIADQGPVARRGETTPAKVRRIAVVGGGPAGLSAAYQLARAGHRVVVHEKEPRLGGVLTTGIPPYRLPPEVVAREIRSILALGVEAVTGASVDAAGISALSAANDAVILATGLQRLTVLGVPGAKLGGVEQGLDFLRSMAFHERERLAGHVVVLGGGNTAMDCARTALRSGARKVTVVYRRTRAEMPAIVEEIDEAEAEGVQFLFLRGPVGFYGPDRVGGVELAVMELSAPDDSGRQRPVDTGKRDRLDCDVALLALGSAADDGLLLAGQKLRNGRVYAGDVPTNVFAAGDVSTTEGTVTHAIGDGRRIAGAVLRALGEDVTLFERLLSDNSVRPKEVRTDYFEHAPRREGGHLPPEIRARSYDEVNRGLADKSEAGRCFSCGHCTECDTCLVYCPEGIIFRRTGGYTVDLENCKGCGLCAAECPRGAIQMEAL